MHTLTFAEMQENFAKTLQNISDNAQPVRIICPNGFDVVIMDAKEYDAMIETLYLLNHPNNAAHINASLDELERGKVIEIDMPDINLKTL